MVEVSDEWVAKNLKRIDKLKAQCRRDTRKLERLTRHVERQTAQVQALIAAKEQQK
jgi:hypothetical protein